jgi:lipoprotein LprG
VTGLPIAGPAVRRTGSRVAAVLLALALGLALAGCGGGADGTGGRTPGQRLATAKAALDDTPGVRVALATDELPRGVSGLLDADGVGTHDPAFAGTIKVSAGGITADAEVVAVDGVVHAKLPFTTSFVEIDPADYGAPDPAALMSRTGGLSSLLTAAQDVEEGDQVRNGDAVLSRLTGTVPGTAVATLIPSASPEADFAADFTLDSSDRATRIVLSGPFYPDAPDVTYTVELLEYGVERDITAP